MVLRMNIKFYTLNFLILTLTLNCWANNLYSEKQVEKLAKTTLKNKDIWLKEKITVTNKENKQEPVFVYLFGEKDGLDFYVTITQAKGRYDLFDYLVVVNLNYEIKTVRVLKYRSEHGGEIAAKKWLEQFKGYSSGELRYKKEISAISGATISAKSITADIPLLLHIIRLNT